jgi:glycosyltransferase involved in cell wall biosynthesis
MPDLPKITIVTPSFNQAPYVAETINSVLHQNYPNLEYIIVDGGSTDGSVNIIKSYANHLAWWVSEADQGQTHALIKGFERSTGDILTWLCSDDLLVPGALWTIAGVFMADPSLDLVYGDTAYLFPDGHTKTKRKISFDYKMMLYAYSMIPQPSSFYTRRIYDKAHGLDKNLHYAMDFDLFLRMGPHIHALHLPIVLSKYRLHPQSKTASGVDKFAQEWEYARKKILNRRTNALDRARSYYYLLKAVWRFYVENGELVLGHDKAKWL